MAAPVLIAFNNRADGATLAGGNWSSTLPLANLQDGNISKPARTTSATRANTRFRADLGANFTLRALALVNNNFSTAAQWRVRAGRASFDAIFGSAPVDSRITSSGGTNGTRVNSTGNIVAATAPRIDYSPVNLASGVATQTLSSVTSGRYALVITGTGASVTASGSVLRNGAAVTAYAGVENEVEVTATGSVTLTVSGTATALHFRECLGLLVEEARTNKFLRSGDFAASDWVKSNLTVTAGAAAGPDGTLSGQKVEATTTGPVALTQTISATSTSEVMYFVVRQGSLPTNDFVLRNSTTAANLIDVTLTWATKALTGTGAADCVVVDAGGGWFVVCLVATAGISVSDTLIGYAGAAGGTAAAGAYWYIWGGQSEAGVSRTTYIPTTSAAVTRAQDFVGSSGTNFSEWFNASTGTLYAEATPNVDLTFYRGLASLNDGTDGNVIQLEVRPTTNDVVAEVYNGVSQAALVPSALAAGAATRTAVAFAVNDFAAVADGGSVATDPSGVLPTVSRLAIGVLNGTTQFCLNGHIKRITYFPERLSNADLVTLTTSGPDALGFSTGGFVDIKQMTFQADTPTDWAAQYPAMVSFDAITARYLSVELLDPNNTAGYVQIGRLFVGGGLQSSANTQGFTAGRMDLSTVQTAVNGRRFGTARRRARTLAFQMPYLEQADADLVSEMQAAAGVLDEVLIVPNPDDAGYSQRYGGLGHLQELSVLDYPSMDLRNAAFSWKERL